MLIHQVVASEQSRHEIDPRRGLVLRKEKVLSPGGAAVIASPEFGTYEADEHGTFDVPDELGQHLCGGPGWYEGPNPFGDSLGAVEPDESDEERDKREQAAADAAEREVEKRVEARLKEEREREAAKQKASDASSDGKPRARGGRGRKG